MIDLPYILQRHYALREEMIAAFIEETRSGPLAVSLIRRGSYPTADEWVVPVGGWWRRQWARLSLLAMPALRRHVREQAARFHAFCFIPATEARLVVEPEAGSLMRVRFEPRDPQETRKDGEG